MTLFYTLYTYLFIIGLVVGSFLNVVLFRMTSEKKFWQGRSECMHCHHTLRWYELVPVVSYVVQKGQCRHCKAFLSIQYPLVEIVTALGFIGIFFIYVPNIESLLTITIWSTLEMVILLVLWTQICIVFVYDWCYQLIPTLQLRVIQYLGLMWVTVLSFQQGQMFSGIYTGILCALGILLLFIITKKQGMGWGDIELFLGLGFFIPLIASYFVFVGSFLIGSVIGIISLCITRSLNLKQKMAFGPSIIISCVLGFVLSKTELINTMIMWYTI